MFKTREQLVEFVERYGTSCGVPSDAIDEGEYELLGGFSQLPASNHSGFILRIKHKRVWLIGIRPTGKMSLVKDAPWRLWQGNVSKNPLYYGDRPEIYARIKMVTTERNIQPDIQKNPTSI